MSPGDDTVGSSPDPDAAKYVSTSRLASTSALILGLLSLLAIAVTVLAIAFDWGWFTSTDWIWVLFPGLAFGCGITALYLGIVGMREARREPEGEGFGRSIFASVTGGLVVLVLVTTILAFIALFIAVAHEYPQG